ncbi:MAG: hypothetical protein AVDCRST_MAG85-2035, partial [uncultured Solirubrobacteraceae bacterium]
PAPGVHLAPGPGPHRRRAARGRPGDRRRRARRDLAARRL